MHELDDGLGRNFGFATIGFLSLIIGHGAWGMGHGAWGMGHGAWGMGPGAWGKQVIGNGWGRVYEIVGFRQLFLVKPAYRM
ncbi:hypothetical protein QUA86_04180 [Microcoleus sp. F6_B6]